MELNASQYQKQVLLVRAINHIDLMKEVVLFNLVLSELSKVFGFQRQLVEPSYLEELIAKGLARFAFNYVGC